MIKVTCPNNNIPERTYAIDFVFGRLLGLAKVQEVDSTVNSTDDIYSVEYSQSEVSYIIKSERTKLIVKDYFWNSHKAPLSYLNRENLPGELTFFHALGFEIPIIYGEDLFEQGEDFAVLGVDIFASVFFMLSRWEEVLLGREDNGDCDENQLWAVNNDIYKRPIVHEYEFLLRRLLLLERANANDYKVIMTHDVDGIITPSYSDIIKTGIRDKLYGRPKNKTINLSWRQKLNYKRSFPRTTSQLDLFTKLCSERNIPEWFFIKVCKPGEVESTYSYEGRQINELMSYLKQSFQHNVKIGFHPSQTTFKNEIQWTTEADRINMLLQEDPSIGRNHHLLYNSKTYQLWDDLLSGQESVISNCVFHKHIGFRSGVAIPYQVFDVFNRKQLRIFELPCQIMDTAIRQYKYSSDDDLMKDVFAIVDEVRKYQGSLVLTWHIYVRDTSLIKDYFNICNSIVVHATNE